MGIWEVCLVCCAWDLTVLKGGRGERGGGIIDWLSDVVLHGRGLIGRHGREGVVFEISLIFFFGGSSSVARVKYRNT